MGTLTLEKSTSVAMLRATADCIGEGTLEFYDGPPSEKQTLLVSVRLKTPVVDEAAVSMSLAPAAEGVAVASGPVDWFKILSADSTPCMAGVTFIVTDPQAVAGHPFSIQPFTIFESGYGPAAA